MDKRGGWESVDLHRVLVADLLEGLSDDQWETPSLCEGWRIRDVAAHLSMAATSTVGEVLRWTVRARGNFDTMIRESATDRARRPTADLVADLRGIVGSRKLAPATFWRDPLLDVIVHAHDIADPLGIPVAADPDAARTAVDWVWARRFPFFPARRLRGLQLVATDVDWSRGSGPVLRGPVESLLLISTGRAAGLAALEGPGLEPARTRLGAPLPRPAG